MADKYVCPCGAGFLSPTVLAQHAAGCRKRSRFSDLPPGARTTSKINRKSRDRAQIASPMRQRRRNRPSSGGALKLCERCRALRAEPNLELRGIPFTNELAQVLRQSVTTNCRQRHTVDVSSVLLRYSLAGDFVLCSFPDRRPHGKGVIVRSRCGLLLRIGDICAGHSVEGWEDIARHLAELDRARQLQDSIRSHLDRCRGLSQLSARVASLNDKLRSQPQERQHRTHDGDSGFGLQGPPSIQSLYERYRAIELVIRGRPDLNKLRRELTKVRDLEADVRDAEHWVRQWELRLEGLRRVPRTGAEHSPAHIRIAKR